jgi:hypothetical protein
MINKYIICIILGIILYILINKIEGLTCRGPLDAAIGNPDRLIRLNRLNKGSSSFFPKDNVMVRNTNSRRHINENSQIMREYENGTTFEVICNNGMEDESLQNYGLEDESGQKLAPYTPLTEEGNRITCHNPSKKVIFYNIHGSIETPDTLGIQGTRFTTIPKKMQLIFYLNDGDCHRENLLDTNPTLRNKFMGIYNGQDITQFLIPSAQDNDNSLFNKGYSELETIDNIYMLFIDSANSLSDLENQNTSDIVYNNEYYNNVYPFNIIYSVTCTEAFYQDSTKGGIYNAMLNLDRINLLYLIGPYSGLFPIIDFSSNNYTLNEIIDRNPGVLRSELYFSVESATTNERRTFTYTYNIQEMEYLKEFIKILIDNQSEMVPISYLSETFKSSDSFGRLFNGTTEMRLPIFCISILSHEHFVNPVNDPTYGRYALSGGQYTAQDLINLIMDITTQISSVDESEVKSVYYRKMRSLGMSNDQINTFINECNFSRRPINLLYSIPENYPLLPFMKLWEPWNYPTTSIEQHTIYEWSMQTFLLLIQLFKQDEGEAIDVHCFTCLEGIGEGDRTKNNEKMNYSWQYAYSNEEANDPDKRIGPECQRPYCSQTYEQINEKLNPNFELFERNRFNREENYPKSREITYTKDNEVTGNITINSDNYLYPKLINVRCKNKPEEIQQIYCKYDENAEEQLNYDESIGQLDSSRCYDNRLHNTILDQAVEPQCSATIL